LNPGEKVGLVGPNGAGKTTLFRMIVGEESPDEGDVSIAKQVTIGYFRQDVEEMSGRSVLDEAIAGSGRLGDLHHELEALQHALGDPARAPEMDALLARFGEVQEAYEHLGGYALESQAREVLHGLGFDEAWIDGDGGAGAEPREGAGQDREDRAAEEAPGGEVRVSAAAALGRRGRGTRPDQQGLRRAGYLRSLQPDHPARRTLVGDGKERRRQDHAA